MTNIQLKTGELWEIDGERYYLEQVRPARGVGINALVAKDRQPNNERE